MKAFATCCGITGCSKARCRRFVLRERRRRKLVRADNWTPTFRARAMASGNQSSNLASAVTAGQLDRAAA